MTASRPNFLDLCHGSRYATHTKQKYCSLTVWHCTAGSASVTATAHAIATQLMSDEIEFLPSRLPVKMSIFQYFSNLLERRLKKQKKQPQLTEVDTSGALFEHGLRLPHSQRKLQFFPPLLQGQLLVPVRYQQDPEHLQIIGIMGSSFPSSIIDMSANDIPSRGSILLAIIWTIEY